MFDLEGILERCAKEVSLSDRQRLSFIHGIKQKSTLFNGAGLGAKIIALTGQGGSYRFLRKTRSYRGAIALFRLTSIDGLFQYHQLKIGRDCFGDVGVADLRNSALGEWLSELQSRALFPTLASMSPKVMAEATEAQRLSIESQDEVRSLVLHLQAGRVDEAITVYKRLPTVMQEEKWLLVALLKVAIGQRQGVEFLVQQTHRYYPGDLTFDVMLFTHYTAIGDYPRAHQTLDRLDKSVEGDPYLDSIRADVLVAEGDLDAANAAARRSLSADDTLPMAVSRPDRSRARQGRIRSGNRFAGHSSDEVWPATSRTRRPEELR